MYHVQDQHLRIEKTVDDIGTIVVKEMDQMLGAFCERLQTSLREQVNRWDERFNGIEKLLRDNAAGHHNVRAIFMNGIINRPHHEIVPIQVLRSRRIGMAVFSNGAQNFGGRIPPGSTSKRDICLQPGLGFTCHEQGIYANVVKIEKQGPIEARKTIKSLCVYYDTVPHGEHFSLTDGSEISLEDGDSVDLYMDQFLRRFGMSWDKVRRYGDAVGNHLSSQAGQKRSDGTGSGDEVKRPRENSSI